MADTEIKSYQVALYAGDRTNRARVSITVFDVKASTIGYLLFTDLQPLPVNEPTGTPRGFYPTAEYPHALDLLRNEKPVYLVVDSQGAVSLSTASEPVGEGEGGSSASWFPFKPIA